MMELKMLTFIWSLTRVKLTYELQKRLLRPLLDGFIMSSVDDNPRHILVGRGQHSGFLSHPVLQGISLPALGASFKGIKVEL